MQRIEQPAVERLGAQVKLDGWWWDEFWRKDSEGVEYLAERTKPIHNLITTNAGILLAGLLANEATFTGGITYMGIGDGDSAWDTAMVQPSFADTTLYSELAREAPDSITYTDGAGVPAVGLSKYIQIKTTYDFSSPANNNYIREFGLFGGTATAVVDSGLMVDAIRHARVYKDSSFKWIRYIRLGL